jgi:demethylspheroidene O-methyltransferase
MAASPWRDGWTDWRNRLLSSPRFQRWAASFPLSRPIARWRTRRLFDLVAGFVHSQVLATCVELQLFDLLATGPQMTATIARRADLPIESTRRLMDAAVALGLADRAGPDRYALGPDGAALRGNPGLAEMIGHHRHLYADLSDCLALLRQGGGQGDLAGYWPYARSGVPEAAGADDVGAYSALMAATQPGVAADVLQACPLGGRRRLLDIGGGEGAFLAAAAASAPHLKLMLFDLPAVASRARERLGAAGLLDRTEILAGDFLTDAIPEGADLITLIRILHDHDDAGVHAILRGIRRALPPDGALLIAEPMSAAPARDRIGDAYFGLYLLAMGRGRVRTPQTLMSSLAAAGFRRAQMLPTRNPLLLRAILAHP